MAREWLLRGVDPEELKPTPKDEGPQTPRSKWENFWFHHKLKFWLILFTVVVAVVGITQLFTRDKPDYYVLLITEIAYTNPEREALSALLEDYGEDLDGDGKVEVQVENCIYSANVNQHQNSGIQQVQAHLMAADRMFFIFEPASYKQFSKVLVDDDGQPVDFFATIDWEGKGLIEEGKLYNWKDDPRPIEELSKRSPELYFGVRQAVGSAAGAEELHQQSMELLENFVADHKTNE